MKLTANNNRANHNKRPSQVNSTDRQTTTMKKLRDPNALLDKYDRGNEQCTLYQSVFNTESRYFPVGKPKDEQYFLTDQFFHVCDQSDLS